MQESNSKFKQYNHPSAGPPPYMMRGATILRDGERSTIQSLLWENAKGFRPETVRVVFEDGETIVLPSRRLQPLPGEVPEGLKDGAEFLWCGQRSEVKAFYHRRFAEDNEDKLMILFKTQATRGAEPEYLIKVYDKADFNFKARLRDDGKTLSHLVQKAVKNNPHKPIVKRSNRKPGR